MRRYTVLLLISFFLIVAVFSMGLYISGRDSHRDSSGRLLSEITVYTTLPTENIVYLATAYEKEYRVRVNFVPLSEQELEEKIQETGHADMVLADSKLLKRAAGKGYLVPYSSEYTDTVGKDFKNIDDYWIGVWYDPVVFCVNKDYLKLNDVPLSWQDLGSNTKARIGITDFLAADNAANIYFFLVAEMGETRAMNLMQRMHPHVVQYSKYLSTPVRMAGMNEVDVAIAVQSEALRYVAEGYPIKLVQPQEGTAYTLTGAGILLKAPQSKLAQDFLDWLLTDEAQLVLRSNNFYFWPANPATLAGKTLMDRNITVFKQSVDYTPEKRSSLLDNWVKNVRLRDN